MVFRTLVAVPISVIVVAFCGCGKRNVDLDRQTAQRLVASRQFPHVTFGIHNSPFNAPVSASGDPYQNRNRMVRAYAVLDQAGVLRCTNLNMLLSASCAPGPKLAHSGNDIIVDAGHYVAGDVTGVSQTGPAAAMADVQLNFVRSPLFSEYYNQFATLDEDVVRIGQNRTARATFRRYDDGWRLEQIQ